MLNRNNPVLAPNIVKLSKASPKIIRSPKTAITISGQLQNSGSIVSVPGTKTPKMKTSTPRNIPDNKDQGFFFLNSSGFWGGINLLSIRYAYFCTKNSIISTTSIIK